MENGGNMTSGPVADAKKPPEISGECRLRKSGCFTNATECQKSLTRHNRKRKEERRSTRRSGSMVVILLHWLTRSRLQQPWGTLGDFADVFQTRSPDQVQWSVAVKKRSRSRAALLAVIDDAYVRAFIK